MILYTLILIPIIFIIVLFFLFKKKITFLEYLGLLIPSIMIIVIAKAISDGSQNYDSEILGEYTVKISYFEEWNEYIQRTCTRQVPSGTDSNGNTRYTTETYDCSYVAYHAPEYIAYFNTGNAMNISESEYLKYKKIWKNSTYIDMDRDYHSIDGDCYSSKWDGKFDNILYHNYLSSYTNKVQNSNSIFSFQEVDTSYSNHLYKFPEKDRDIRSYYSNFKISKKLNDDMERYNSLMGMQYEVRMHVLLFKNRSYDYGVMQESFWKGGNKNELNVCIGVNDSLFINWVYVFTWSGNKMIKAELEDKINDMGKFCGNCVNSLIVEEVKNSWQRKHFSDFDYLQNEPSSFTVGITFVSILILCIGMSIFIVRNEYNSGVFNNT